MEFTHVHIETEPKGKNIRLPNPYQILKNLASEDIRRHLSEILHDSIDFQNYIKLYVLALNGHRFSLIFYF